MITIDGSQGEGGGQIVRTSLALSMVKGQPFRIENVRAGRDKPGLLRQHLTAVHAAQTICNADVDGASIGSPHLLFKPKAVVAGDYKFAIGTAGSTTLVLQTILPALMAASSSSTVVLEGGTHNPFAPPVDFLDRVFLPFVRKIGPRVDIVLDRAGFYPAGGGRLRATIEPAPLQNLGSFDVHDRGDLRRRVAWGIVAHLSGDIAKRELAIIEQQLGWSGDELKIRQLPDEQGPGNVLLVEVEYEHVTEMFTAFGARGVTAEAVGVRAATEAREYLATAAPIGPHLADQLLLPLALAGGGSFTTMPPTPHTTTNAAVIERFLGVRFGFEKGPKDTVRVQCSS